MTEHPHSILVVGPSWVGDMVMAQCLYIVLKRLHPAVHIDVLAPAWSEPLLTRMPEVRQSLHMPVGHGRLALRDRYQLGKQLRGSAYDQAILLPNSLKSALVPLFAKIPRRTGWRGEMRYGLLNDIRRLDKQRYPLMVQRFVALAYPQGEALPEPIPAPQLLTHVADQNAAIAALQLHRERPVLALCPGAEFGPAKRWPSSHYAQVAAEKIDQGWQVWLFGSEKDRPVADEIRQGLSGAQQQHCVSLAGDTTLGQAVDLLAVADAVVSNDSGLMHVAAALQKPLVVIYGSTSPEFTPPLNQQKQILQIPVDCGPCFQRQCPLGHMKCLTGIPASRVLAALAQLEANA